MFGINGVNFVFGKGSALSKDSGSAAVALMRLADMLSLDQPNWLVLTLAEDTKDDDKLKLVTGNYTPLNQVMGDIESMGLVVCMFEPAAINNKEWMEVRLFHKHFGKEGSPIFIGYPASRSTAACPMSLGPDLTCSATYIVTGHMFHSFSPTD